MNRADYGKSEWSRDLVDFRRDIGEITSLPHGSIIDDIQSWYCHNEVHTNTSLIFQFITDEDAVISDEMALCLTALYREVIKFYSKE